MPGSQGLRGQPGYDGPQGVAGRQGSPGPITMLPSLPIPGTWSLLIYSASGVLTNTPNVNLLPLVGKARVLKIDFQGRNGGDFKKVSSLLIRSIFALYLD